MLRGLHQWKGQWTEEVEVRGEIDEAGVREDMRGGLGSKVDRWM